MDKTGRKITKIAREVTRLVIRTIRDEGVGSGELDLIHAVRHSPGISQKDAAAMLNMDKGAVARRVASLEGKGYLIRKADPDDSRRRMLYPTERAEGLRNSREQVEAAFYEWLLEELEPEEADRFCETLDKLYLRSKAESRSGFGHVMPLIEGEKSI